MNLLFVIIGAGLANNAKGAALLDSTNGVGQIIARGLVGNSKNAGLNNNATDTTLDKNSTNTTVDSNALDSTIISNISSATLSNDTTGADQITDTTEAAPISSIYPGKVLFSNDTREEQVRVTTTTLAPIIDPITRALIDNATSITQLANNSTTADTTSSSTELRGEEDPSRKDALEALDRMETIMSEAEKLLTSEQRMVSHPTRELNSSDLRDFLLIQRIEQLSQRAQQFELRLQNMHLENLLLRSNSGFANHGFIPFEMRGGDPGRWRDNGYEHGRGRPHGGRGGHGGHRGHGGYGGHRGHGGHRRRGHGNGGKEGGLKEVLGTAVTALTGVSLLVKVGTMLAAFG